MGGHAVGGRTRRDAGSVNDNNSRADHADRRGAAVAWWGCGTCTNAGGADLAGACVVATMVSRRGHLDGYSDCAASTHSGCGGWRGSHCDADVASGAAAAVDFTLRRTDIDCAELDRARCRAADASHSSLEPIWQCRGECKRRGTRSRGPNRTAPARWVIAGDPTSRWGCDSPPPPCLGAGCGAWQGCCAAASEDCFCTHEVQAEWQGNVNAQ